MNRQSLAPDRGMIFPYDPPQPASFWMKNTLIPLDMIFIRADGSDRAHRRQHGAAVARAGAVAASRSRRCWRSPAAARPSSASAPATRSTGRARAAGRPGWRSPVPAASTGSGPALSPTGR